MRHVSLVLLFLLMANPIIKAQELLYYVQDYYHNLDTTRCSSIIDKSVENRINNIVDEIQKNISIGRITHKKTHSIKKEFRKFTKYFNYISCNSEWERVYIPIIHISFDLVNKSLVYSSNDTYYDYSVMYVKDGLFVGELKLLSMMDSSSDIEFVPILVTREECDKDYLSYLDRIASKRPSYLLDGVGWPFGLAYYNGKTFMIYDYAGKYTGQQELDIFSYQFYNRWEESHMSDRM